MIMQNSNMQKKCREISKTKQKFVNQNIQTKLSKARKSSKIQHSNKSSHVGKKKLCPEGCKKHLFQLKAVGYSSFLTKGLTQPLGVNFCSKGNSITIPIPIVPYELIKQPQVPLFILKQQTHRYEYYMQSHRQQFQDAIKKAQKQVQSDQQQQMLVAIPKTKNCQICRIKIDNQKQYQKHINSIDHRIALKRSLGQKFINQDTQFFQKQTQIQNQTKQKLDDLKQISQILKQAKRTIKNLLKNK